MYVSVLYSVGKSLISLLLAFCPPERLIYVQNICDGVYNRMQTKHDLLRALQLRIHLHPRGHSNHAPTHRPCAQKM